MDHPRLTQLQHTVEREMPITRAMGIHVVSYDDACLAMRMPLEPNRNHQYSAFAGSLNALCTVVGWGTLFLLLEQAGLRGNIVIRRGKIRYLRPVRGAEFVATALAPQQTEYFFELLRSKGKSKLDVEVQIADQQGPAVRFLGSYVVQEPLESS